MREHLNAIPPTEVTEVSTETIRREDYGSGLVWLAGIIDGEGSICASLGASQPAKARGGVPKRSLGLRLVIKNTSTELIDKAAAVLREYGVMFSLYYNKPCATAREALQLSVSGRGMIKKAINLLLPYLVAKREQAQQMLYIIQHREILEILPKSQWAGKLENDPTLRRMVQRLRDLNAYRANLLEYHRQTGSAVTPVKPSTTTRLTALSPEQCSRMI